MLKMKIIHNFITLTKTGLHVNLALAF